MLQAEHIPLRVLALDDEAMISMAIEDALCDAGYAVDSVATSHQALTLLNTERFDAAVIDIGLRSGDSHLVAEALSIRHIPFVFCTASSSPLERPFADVPLLDKPFSDIALLEALARLVP